MAIDNQAWDAPENEAQNNFVSWGKVGDFLRGTLISVKEVESTLPDRKGEMQKVYEVLVAEGSYHTLDDKKQVVEPAVVLNAGDIVSLGGRKTIDSRMARIKIGQNFGVKFTEELPAKTKGYNATKLIKVYTPKAPNGEFAMNTAWLDEQAKIAAGE